MPVLRFTPQGLSLSKGTFAGYITLVCAVGMLASCKGSPPSGDEDAGGPGPNNCSSQQTAMSSSLCVLNLGQTVSDFIRSLGDQVWYRIPMPATVDPRTLVQVTAGYSAPSTPVNLGVNLLNAVDGRSLGRLVDDHSQGAPQPVNFIVRYAVANGVLLVFLSDQSSGRPNFDARNPFTLSAQAIIDPDPNHPNNIVPTP